MKEKGRGTKRPTPMPTKDMKEDGPDPEQKDENKVRDQHETIEDKYKSKRTGECSMCETREERTIAQDVSHPSAKSAIRNSKQYGPCAR